LKKQKEDNMFEKILIANRGEIALRIIRACKELGIKTVAVYSEADKYSLHVRFADETICIGYADPLKSYLNIPFIISAAEIANADAIHPGYGFLSENSHFVGVCKECNITFIGPSSLSIGQMGDKATARKIMQKAGVPITPGSDGIIENAEDALSFAREIGFPVMIKATAGGGGKGMRIVHNENDFIHNFTLAQTEAKKFFNNPGLYVEKFIENPRHIEFQILADTYGNTIHLGERDCSIQRRNQKLIEETPSTALTPKLRAEMGEIAVQATKSVNYHSAGTVEFIMDENNNFYFMEMNTRIQVEHPITEMITGVDLVKEQIKIAAGEKLSISQSDVKINGHSIECRINAENPQKNFIPSPGTITSLHLPGGPNVRTDTFVYQGSKITPYYDSLIAKLIVHGKTRDEAIAIMRRALSEFIVEGIETTIPFHLDVLKNRKFKEGEYNTGFISDEMKIK